MRASIRHEVESIIPWDEQEATTITAALAWIDSGAPLCRVIKPDTPKKHLVAYFVLVDGDFLLLVDHINAQLWLPTGGHVEPNEHPRATAIREAAEELSIQAEFLRAQPVFITSTTTVGITAGHIDVSLWYLLKGDRNLNLAFDQSEFSHINWFHKDRIPQQRTVSDLQRFIDKLYYSPPHPP